MMESRVSRAYIARCHRALKKREAPLDGWACEGVIDHGEDDFTCELCGCTRVRYVHAMRHNEYPFEINVGCICAGIMEGDILAAEERDAEAKRRSQRKSNYLKKQWNTISDGLWQLQYKRRTISIEQDSFRGVDFFKINIAGEQYHWKENRRMNSFLTAQHFIFDLIDQEENHA